MVLTVTENTKCDIVSTTSLCLRLCVLTLFMAPVSRCSFVPELSPGIERTSRRVSLDVLSLHISRELPGPPLGLFEYLVRNLF